MLTKIVALSMMKDSLGKLDKTKDRIKLVMDLGFTDKEDIANLVGSNPESVRKAIERMKS